MARLLVYTVATKAASLENSILYVPPNLCRELFILLLLESRIKNNKFERLHMQIERLDDFICRSSVTSFTCEQTAPLYGAGGGVLRILEDK